MLKRVTLCMVLALAVSAYAAPTGVVMSDDFTGTAGTSPNAGNWTVTGGATSPVLDGAGNLNFYKIDGSTLSQIKSKLGSFPDAGLSLVAKTSSFTTSHQAWTELNGMGFWATNDNNQFVVTETHIGSGPRTYVYIHYWSNDPAVLPNVNEFIDIGPGDLLMSGNVVELGFNNDTTSPKTWVKINGEEIWSSTEPKYNWACQFPWGKEASFFASSGNYSAPDYPTPAATLADAKLEILNPTPTTATPTFTPDAGTYTTEIDVTISCSTPGATIYYTIDGSLPSAMNYAGSITGGSGVVRINQTTQLKALAIGSDESLLKVGQYNILIHPVGTVFVPKNDFVFIEPNNPGPDVMNPVIDSVTGNPIQAFYIVGRDNDNSNILEGTEGPVDNRLLYELQYTHDYSQYASSLNDQCFRDYFWVHTLRSNIGGSNAPAYDFKKDNQGFPRVALRTHVYRYFSSVWAFVAPHDSDYMIEGTICAKKEWANVPCPVEVFTFTGPGHTTYTNIATFDTVDPTPWTLVTWGDNLISDTYHTYMVPTTTLTLKAGDMICVAAYGGPQGEGLYPVNQNVQAIINYDPDGTENDALVKITRLGPTSSTPVITPPTGTYASTQTVSMSADPNAIIRYTTNGLDPDETSTTYTAPLTISSSTTIKARAWTPGKEQSSVATAVYTIVAATPTLAPGMGFYSTSKSVTISCATPNAIIRYTTNGSEPDVNSTVYTTPITVSVDNTTVKAKAWVAGCDPSAVGSATYFFPASFNQPADIPQGTATIDGNLTEWSNATWAPLNMLYYGSVSDVPEAYYTARWSQNKVYLAVKVRDTNHVFNDSCEFTEDEIEIYLHTTGYSIWPSSDYRIYLADAQQYITGPTFSDANVTWTWMGINGGVSIPTHTGFASACTVSGQWIYYEVAMTPFEYFDMTGATSVVSTLSAGQVIGLDVVVTSNGAGMMAENLLQWKSQDYLTFGLHKLASAAIPGDANGDGMVDVGDLGILAANYGGSGKTWAQGDFNGDGLVDVGDLGILAANYGTGVNGSVDFTADYAKAFGTAAAEEDDSADDGSSICSGLGLPLIIGLALMGLMLVKLEE